MIAAVLALTFIGLTTWYLRKRQQRLAKERAQLRRQVVAIHRRRPK